MNRTLTASVALAATLGMAGLAMAQGYAPNANTTQDPGQNPGMTTTPAAPTAGVPPSSSGSYGGQQTMQGQQGQQPTSPASILQAQQQLRSQGLYNGAIDGQLGPEMKSALMQFQQRNGLPQTGTLDQQTSARLAQQSNNGLGPTPTNGAPMQGTAQPNLPTPTNR